MKRWVVAFVILNLLDAVSTLFIVGFGYGVEVNPLMRAALGFSPAAFAVIKIATSAVALVFWNAPATAIRERMIFRGVVGVFGAVIIWHALNWIWILQAGLVL